MISNMYFVYVLYSIKDGKLYVGYTADLDTRINKHKKGLVPATQNRLPLKLIGYEAYLTMSDAKRREKFLKGGKGRAEMKIQYQDTLTKIGYRFR